MNTNNHLVKFAHVVDSVSRKDGETDARVFRIQNTGDADTDYAVAHGLGRVPVGCVIQLSSVDCRVYKGSVWDSTNAYLKFTAANADVNIRIW